MKTIYVVTSGSYSDYGIDAIFDTKELAQAFIDSFRHDGFSDFNDIEKWELNPNEAELKAHRKAFRLTMNKEGNIQSVENSNSSYGHKEGLTISFTANSEWLNVYCYADDERHAVKIANEKRTQILALNRWGNENPLPK